MNIPILSTVWERFLFLVGWRSEPLKSVRGNRQKTRRVNRSKNVKVLLDDLNSIYSKVEKIKRKKEFNDPLVYKFGIHIIDRMEDTDGVSVELDSFQEMGFPSIMAFSMLNLLKKEDVIQPVFVVEKKKRIPNVQYAPALEHRYLMTMYFELDGIVHTQEYPISVSNEGKVRALRVRANGNFGGSQWIYPPILCNDNPVPYRDRKNQIEKHFKLAYNLFARREMSAQIHAVKRGIRLTFNVPQHEWKYFFRDRITVMDKGVKKKIFHYVAGHKRTNKNGKVSFVKTHARGLTEFGWAGFRIKIIVPGFNGESTNSFQATALDVRGLKRSEKEKTVQLDNRRAEEIYKLITNGR